MAFSVQINVERKLAVINGFVSIPDGQRQYNNRLTPLDVLALIPGSTLVRLGPGDIMQEILVLDPTAPVFNKISWRQNDQLFIRLPAYERMDGPADDWFQTLRDAAAAVS